MNSGTMLLSVYEPLPQWLNFLAMAGGLLLGTFAVLIWFLAHRKKRKRKRKPRHHEKRRLNPTLAEAGGLPPAREEKKTDTPDSAV
jgi:hypothetical protein